MSASLTIANRDSLLFNCYLFRDRHSKQLYVYQKQYSPLRTTIETETILKHDSPLTRCMGKAIIVAMIDQLLHMLIHD